MPGKIAASPRPVIKNPLMRPNNSGVTGSQGTKVPVTNTGWKAGAKPAPLKLSKAVISMDYGMEKGFAAPKGVKVSVSTSTVRDSIKLPGNKTAHLECDYQNLSVTLANGKKVALVKSDAAAKEMKEWFRADFTGLKKEDMGEYLPLEYSESTSVQGFGTAGKLMSIVGTTSQYTGGAHPNNGFALSTYDVNTGKELKLKDVLSKDQLAGIKKTITEKLKTLKGTGDAEGLDGTSFGGGDAKYIADIASGNFAISTDKNGKASITIGIPAGFHAAGPTMALFTFDAPTDAAFKAKAGL